MTILQDRLAAIATDTSISSKVRSWANEATSRIEKEYIRGNAQDKAIADLQAKLAALTTAFNQYVASNNALNTSQSNQIAALTTRVAALEPTPPDPLPDPGTPPTTSYPAPPVGPFTLMDGGGTQHHAIDPVDPSGMVIEKLHVQNYDRTGIGIMIWPQQEVTAPVTVRDCIIENVSAIPPRSRNGTSEACLWIGNKTNVNRVKIRNGAWMGMWTGSLCHDSVFEDIEISDCPHVGLYIEHQTKRVVFRRCSFSAMDNAVNIEWWYGGEGSNSILFEDCTFNSTNGWGIFADAGTYDLTVRRCKFLGKNGIALPKNLVDPTKPNNFDAASCDLTGVTGIKTTVHNNAIG